MALKLTNTLTRRQEGLEPIVPGKVSLYTCGPTVYDTAHIGNMRTFVFEDLLKRYLLYKGYEVLHVMNVTDVDDRTIGRAIEENRPLADITEQYTQQFLADLETLNILPADHLPRATEFIPKMVAGIELLLEKGHAYQTPDGSIFFDVSSYPDYGQLARLDPAELRTGERVMDDSYEKAEARDFALWKAHKPSDGDYYWPSPWGPGRPGWHMECSIMATHYLGDHLDIHCGGVDNIFPHHENELAQSRCLADTPFVNMWVHGEHLIVNGKKMSKSLGNFYTLSDLLEQNLPPEAIRYTLLTTNYRQKLNFKIDRVHESQKAINRLRELDRRLRAVAENGGDRNTGPLPPDEAVEVALDDDLNISGALGAIFGWAKELFTRLDGNDLSAGSARKSIAALERYDSLLGVIRFSTPADDEAEIYRLVRAREEARRQGDWAQADTIRDELQARGILLEDTPGGTTWKRG